MNAKFEQYARQQINRQEVEVDAEALWADIYPQLKPVRDYKRYVWFFASGLLVLLSLLAVFYFTKSNTKTTVVEQPIATTTEANDASINQQATEDLSEIAPTINPTTELNNADSNTPVLDNSSNISNSNPKTPKVAGSSAKLSSGSSSIVKNEAPGELLPQETEENEMATAVSKRNFKAVDRLPGLVPESVFSNQLKIMDNALLTLTTEDEDLLPANARKNTPDIFRDIRFGVGLYGGISQSNSDLEAKTEAAENFVVARTNAEKQLETIHVGLNAVIQTSKNLYLRTGAEYTRIGSLFSKSGVQVTMDTMLGIVEYQINEITGDTTFIEGDVIVTRTTQYNKKSYNYFHLIDVPVIFGYNFGDVDDNWLIGIEAGIYANVFIKNKGEIPMEDGVYYDIGEDPEKWYKTNIGISPFVGLNAAYNVSQNIQVHLTPSFRFNSVYSTSANPIMEKRGSLGVQAGVRYFFD